MNKNKVVNRISPCPLCCANDARIQYRFLSRNYLMCCQCNLLSVDPIPDSTHMNQRADLWSQFHHQNKIKIEQQYSEKFQSFAYQPLLKLIKQYKLLGRMIDVGCGVGGFLSAIKRAGWEEWGIDVSQSIQIARDYGLKVIQERFDEAILPANHFDVVSMIEVIEHINQIDTVMRQIIKILRLNGGLLLVTPNLNSLNSRLLRQKWGAIDPDDHLLLFTPATISTLLGKYGFTVRKLYTYDFNPLELTRLCKDNNSFANRLDRQAKKRTMLTYLTNLKPLQGIRYLLNIGLNLTKMGERLIVIAELTCPQVKNQDFRKIDA